MYLQSLDEGEGVILILLRWFSSVQPHRRSLEPTVEVWVQHKASTCWDGAAHQNQTPNMKTSPVTRAAFGTSPLSLTPPLSMTHT